MSQPDWINEMVARLSQYDYEEWEHRSAVMEFDGKLPRDHAECLALLNILKNHPAALLGKEL